MTVKQNIAFGLKTRNMPQRLIDERVDEMLTMIGLAGWQDHYPAQLSGGQQQRVALGRAIAIKPNVLLLDEPLSALDAKIRVRLRTVIKRLQQDLGVTLIYVTHDQEEALALADRVVIMRDGRFRQIGTPFEIYKRPQTSFVAEFVGTSNFISGFRTGDCIQCGSRKLAVAGADGVGDDGDTIHLAIRPESIEVVGSKVTIEECTPENIVETRAEVINFLGAVVRITFLMEEEEMFIDIPEKDFEKMTLARGDKLTLHFPPDAFYAYTEMFSKLI
jgi:putative spermidine/putrescine transport system ATP-binding protein